MNNQNGIQIKILNKQMASAYDDDSKSDVGLILRCASSRVLKIYPGKCELVPTGIAVHFGISDYVARIEPEYKNSDLSHFIKVTTIGCDQEEEVLVSIRNDSSSVLHLRQHDQIGQLVFGRAEKNFTFIDNS